MKISSRYHPVFKIISVIITITFLWQQYFCVLVGDALFFLSHRILHTRFFFKHVHKLHHKYT